MYLTQGIHRALQAHPAKLALCEADTLAADDGTAPRLAPLDYAALAQAVGQHAAALQRHGIGSGQRVALLAPNSGHLVLQLLACWWLGAVACPLNIRWTMAEIRQALADCSPGLMLVDTALHASCAVELGGSVPVVDGARFAIEAQQLDAIEDSRSGGDALAAILYTGGTTGRAKGVMLTHANFWSAALARAAELPNAPDSVSLLVAPLFHVAGLGRLIGQVISGASCVTLSQFRAEAALRAIERLGISDIIVVPTMLQALLDHPSFSSERSRSLQRLAFGAAPMPPDLLARALAAWPQALFFQAYGLTETAAAVCINLPLQHYVNGQPGPRSHAVGRAGLGAEIRVIDPQGHDVPPGMVGEVILRGPMITQGYWQQPEATAQALRQGWLHTGDSGRMDEEGYLYIVDRMKDMVISGGENVYPAEVEAVLRRHPAVAEAAVIGLPDAHWGERVHAVLVLNPHAQADDALTADLLQWCRRDLAGYKCPRSLSYRDSLPLSAAGKVLKNELRKAAAAP